MKAHLTKVSLALLSVAFLLGCQEQGPDPVGPEGLGPEFDHKGKPHGKPGGSGDADSLTLTLAGGMETATSFWVGGGKVSRKEKAFVVGNHNQEHPIITMQFTSLGLGTCEGFAATNGGTIPVPGDGLFEDLVAELGKVVGPAQVKVEVDIDQERPEPGQETGPLTLPRHLLQVFDYESRLIRLGSSWGPSFLDATVVWKRIDGNTDEFTFTGPVWVWDMGGGAKDTGGVYCSGTGPEPNKVVATLVRIPASN